MPRIDSNATASSIAHRDLVRSSRQINQAMTRLSSGLRIQRPADDPAAWISSELLANQTTALDPAIDQAQRAGNLVATADDALSQISDLLLTIQTLITEAANTDGVSSAEVAANQLQVDAAVDSIRQLANSTTFAGRRLIDGTMDYTLSGVDPAAITSVRATAADLGTAGRLPVRIDVTAAAEHGMLQFRASQVTGDTTLRLAGTDGATSLDFAAGTTASAVLAAINSETIATGISATFINPLNLASGLQLTGRDLGSNSFVSVEPLTGTFDTVSVTGVTSSLDDGADAVATINDIPASADGNRLAVASAGLDMAVQLAANFTTGQQTFIITGGGARFAIGPTAGDIVSVGIASADPADLGNRVIGFLSDVATGGTKSLVSGNAAGAAAIASEAASQVAQSRGRLGSFATHTLDRSVASMTETLENAESSLSQLRDADFAAEATNLSRAQLLRDTAISILSTANSSREAVLRLLM